MCENKPININLLIIQCLTMGPLLPLKHKMRGQGEMGQEANLSSMLAMEIRGFGTEENSIKLGFLPGWRISFLHGKAQHWRNLSQTVAHWDERGLGLPRV